jgi:hypothetical protein
LKNIKISSEAITRLKSTNRLMYNMNPLNFHWTIPLRDTMSMSIASIGMALPKTSPPILLNICRATRPTLTDAIDTVQYYQSKVAEVPTFRPSDTDLPIVSTDLFGGFQYLKNCFIASKWRFKSDTIASTQKNTFYVKVLL